MEGFSMSSNTKNVWNKVVINQVTDITLKSANITVEVVLNQNVIPVTPLDKGRLRKSMSTVKATHSKPYAKIVSKGNIAPYNIRVHELEPPVNWTTPGTSGKFLEVPFKNNVVKTFNRVLKGEMKKNGF